MCEQLKRYQEFKRERESEWVTWDRLVEGKRRKNYITISQFIKT